MFIIKDTFPASPVLPAEEAKPRSIQEFYLKYMPLGVWCNAWIGPWKPRKEKKSEHQRAESNWSVSLDKPSDGFSAQTCHSSLWKVGSIHFLRSTLLPYGI